MKIEMRNARFNQFGTVDVEINHSAHGWIPFTASQDDPEQFGRDVWQAIDMQSVAPYVAPPAEQPTVKDVSAEAERRIATGTTINAVAFRTDDATMIRLRGLLDGFDAGHVPLEGVTYRTAAGATLHFDSRAEAQAVYDAANLFRSTILVASAALQVMDPIPTDYATNESYWQPDNKGTGR